MLPSRAKENAMKITDADKTLHGESRPEANRELIEEADTQASPGLRPAVLDGLAQHRTKAAVRATLFGDEAPTIGRYRVLTRLGEGGMGVVYAAYDERLDRKVALKLLRGAWATSREGRERAIREARALARLSHPNVVHVYEVGEAEDEIYVAMESLAGPTLLTWMTEVQRPWREVLAVFRQAAEGLAAAHRHGVIHRDFKPANAILGVDGRVRVLDFGLAQLADAAVEEGPTTASVGRPLVADAQLTQTGAVLGTPAYMAPEQFAGHRGDAQTDQFSYCIALYEALYQRRPFEGETLQALCVAVVEGKVRPPPSGSEVPAWLHRVIVRGLQSEPLARWPGMVALIAALTPDQRRPAALRIAKVALTVAAAAAGVTWWVRPDVTSEIAAGLEDAQRVRTAATVTADNARLTVARDHLRQDPLAAVRELARLEGDEPTTWQRARQLATVAQIRGLPAKVLGAGTAPLRELARLDDGRLLGRDDLGAVWQWDLRTGASTRLDPGAVKRIVVARDAPVWAAIGDGKARVFVDGKAEPTEVELGGREPDEYLWQLASDGRTLVAAIRPRALFPGTVLVWSLDTPRAVPREVVLTPDTTFVSVVMTGDASLIAISNAGVIRLVRREPATEEVLKYDGKPLAFTSDGRTLIARPTEGEDVLDVFDLSTVSSRQVDASDVLVLSGADVLFSRRTKDGLVIRREALETGQVAWTIYLPNAAGSARAIARRFVVDAAHGRFAAALQDSTWAIGDLHSGTVTTYMAVAETSDMAALGVRPLWAARDILVSASGADVHVLRPDAAPLQVRYDGRNCTMSPAGRYALLSPEKMATDEFTRVELATGATARFRCSTPPIATVLGKHKDYRVSMAIDDAGQVVMTGREGWNCWWDENHGPRAGGVPDPSEIAALPQGVTLVTREGEVSVWTGPVTKSREWQLDEAVTDLQVSPSGELIAVRTELGAVHVMRPATGAITPVSTGNATDSAIDWARGQLAWSPDGTRLAVTRRNGIALRIGVWDVSGEQTREVALHDLADIPGTVSEQISFTPSGEALAFTERENSVTLLDLAAGTRRHVALSGKPGSLPMFGALHGIRMLGETNAIGIDPRGVPVLLDFAESDAIDLAPNPDRSFSSATQLRRGDDGSLWMCNALGAGTMVQLDMVSPPTDSGAIRSWVRTLAL